MNTTVKERPIALTAQEVNAVLAGDKTQHRVPVKLRYGSPEFLGSRDCKKSDPSLWGWDNFEDSETRLLSDEPCPFGSIGDQLWVREDWIPGYKHDPDSGDTGEGRVSIIYKSDKSESMVDSPSYELAEKWMTQYASDGPDDPKWFKAKTMECWASRILLEIADIRIERILDISDMDAKAMGLKPDYCDHKYQTCEDIGCIGIWAEPLMNYFIHEKNIANVSSHDWVWVVEFKKVDK